MSEEISLIELREREERKIYEELGRREFNDPDRRKLVDEARTHAELRLADSQNEMTRLNNNAKNDIEEQRLIIESEKVKNDRRRVRSDIGKGALFFGAAICSSFLSYAMDPWFQKYQPLQELSKALRDLIMKK